MTEEYVATASETAPFFSWTDPVLNQSLNRRERPHSRTSQEGALDQTDLGPTVGGARLPRHLICDCLRAIGQACQGQAMFLQDIVKPSQADGSLEAILRVVSCPFNRRKECRSNLS
jgi:hypothetical protein